ncbi:ABC transporter substrate-binding protein, partial [Nonomuraea angiospora]
VEFTDGDAAKTKSIVSDYIQRYGKIDGVWMDAGATAVAAIEAFEDAGVPVPPINGEDQQDFLQKWKDAGLTAVAPTYPTYQWRTPIIAALKILKGEEVPKMWNLPQPKVTSENLSTYLKP